MAITLEDPISLGALTPDNLENASLIIVDDVIYPIIDTPPENQERKQFFEKIASCPLSRESGDYKVLDVSSLSTSAKKWLSSLLFADVDPKVKEPADLSRQITDPKSMFSGYLEGRNFTTKEVTSSVYSNVLNKLGENSNAFNELSEKLKMSQEKLLAFGQDVVILLCRNVDAVVQLNAAGIAPQDLAQVSERAELEEILLRPVKIISLIKATGASLSDLLALEDDVRYEICYSFDTEKVTTLVSKAGISLENLLAQTPEVRAELYKNVDAVARLAQDYKISAESLLEKAPNVEERASLYEKVTNAPELHKLPGVTFERLQTITEDEVEELGRRHSKVDLLLTKANIPLDDLLKVPKDEREQLYPNAGRVALLMDEGEVSPEEFLALSSESRVEVCQQQSVGSVILLRQEITDIPFAALIDKIEQVDNELYDYSKATVATRLMKEAKISFDDFLNLPSEIRAVIYDKTLVYKNPHPQKQHKNRYSNNVDAVINLIDQSGASLQVLASKGAEIFTLLFQNTRDVVRLVKEAEITPETLVAQTPKVLRELLDNAYAVVTLLKNAKISLETLLAIKPEARQALYENPNDANAVRDCLAPPKPRDVIVSPELSVVQAQKTTQAAEAEPKAQSAAKHSSRFFSSSVIEKICGYYPKPGS